jgi:hypothetical protein
LVANESHQSPIEIKRIPVPLVFALAAIAAPEKRWFRPVSK